MVTKWDTCPESFAVIKPKIVHTKPFRGGTSYPWFLAETSFRTDVEYQFTDMNAPSTCSTGTKVSSSECLCWMSIASFFFFLSVRLRITFVGFSHQLFQISSLKKRSVFRNFWFQVFFWKVGGGSVLSKVKNWRLSTPTIQNDLSLLFETVCFLMCFGGESSWWILDSEARQIALELRNRRLEVPLVAAFSWRDAGSINYDDDVDDDDVDDDDDDVLFCKIVATRN